MIFLKCFFFFSLVMCVQIRMWPTGPVFFSLSVWVWTLECRTLWPQSSLLLIHPTYPTEIRSDIPKRNVQQTHSHEISSFLCREKIFWMSDLPSPLPELNMITGSWLDVDDDPWKFPERTHSGSCLRLGFVWKTDPPHFAAWKFCGKS